MRALGPLLLLALLGACQTTPPSKYVRVTASTGRVYYAHWDRALHSESGGFLTFRDLVTRETVRLKNGTYVAQEVPREEVKIRQIEYNKNPDHKPVVTDYDTDPK